MFKKLNQKILIVAFLLLLILVVISQVVSSRKGERNFSSQLFQADTARISAIDIRTRAAKETLHLKKSGTEWTVTVKGKIYKIEKGMVQSMLNQIAGMKAERIAATDKSEWEKYQVTDTSATRLKIEQDGKVVADLLIGKFSYQRNVQNFTTFVRPYDKDIVYAVNGFLAMTFNKSLDDLRNKNMVGISSSDITRLTFSYPSDSSFVLEKKKGKWELNGKLVSDSLGVKNYVNSLSYTSGTKFVPDSVKSGAQVFALTIEGNNFNPIDIKAYAANTADQYIVTSSVNPGARFIGKNAGLTNRIFVSKMKFLKKTVKKK